MYIRFQAKQKTVNAEIEIYNIIGQALVKEKFGRSSIYSRSLDNLEAAYVIVRVMNEDKVTTKKLFITNNK